MYDVPDCRDADLMTRVMARCSSVEVIVALVAAVFAVAAGAAFAPL